MLFSPTKKAVFIRCLVAFGLGAGGAGWANPTFSTGVGLGPVAIPGLAEASGVVASRGNANVLWTHNDSGHPAELFALDTLGRWLGTFALPGNTDNEDIAIGPGPVPNVSYLYVGDIGDNNANRANIAIYQIPEPAIHARPQTNPVTVMPRGARTITLTYPDGAHNAEAMIVDPVTGDLFIFTKEATARIYLAPKAQLDGSNSFVLTLVRTLAFNVASAADISPTGNEIIVRRESFAQLWSRQPGQTISNAFNSAPMTIPVIGTPTEPNGEAIGFDADGAGYFTLSDDATSQPLYYFARTSNDGPKWPPRTLVAAGATWKYLASDLSPGPAWFTPGFSDSNWPAGTAQFGYGDGDEQTVISYGSDPANKYRTTYFRKSFLVDNAACVTNLVLKMVLDDGAAVYLNGVPVVRENLSADATHTTLAAPTPPALEDTWRSYVLDPKQLVTGPNTLAVEVHLAAANSPNLSFDLQLLAFDVPCVTSLSFPNNGPAQLTLGGPASATATVEVSQTLTNWTSLGAVTLTNAHGVYVDQQATNFNARFYRAQP